MYSRDARATARSGAEEKEEGRPPWKRAETARPPRKKAPNRSEKNRNRKHKKEGGEGRGGKGGAQKRRVNRTASPEPPATRRGP